jgi:hypothetical protein
MVVAATNGAANRELFVRAVFSFQLYGSRIIFVVSASRLSMVTGATLKSRLHQLVGASLVPKRSLVSD